MTDKEKWYRFCMLCEHSYKRADDADMVYCEMPNFRYCPHKKEIEEAEKAEKIEN